MIKIAIGTASQYKLNAIRKALYELDFDFECYSIDANSEVSNQPNKPNETKEGSINRARNALQKLSEGDIGIGVEFGYEPVGKEYKMICWASVVTKDGKIFSEHSSSLELPNKLKLALNSGKDVSDNLFMVLDQLEDKERNRIFKMYLKKRIFIYQSVSAVGIRYLLDRVAY